MSKYNTTSISLPPAEQKTIFELSVPVTRLGSTIFQRNEHKG